MQGYKKENQKPRQQQKHLQSSPEEARQKLWLFTPQTPETKAMVTSQAQLTAGLLCSSQKSPANPEAHFNISVLETLKLDEHKNKLKNEEKNNKM